MPARPSIDCRLVRDLLPLWRDGVVSDETAAFVRSHLATCAECRELAGAVDRHAEAITAAAATLGDGDDLPPFVPRLRRVVVRAVIALVILALLAGAGLEAVVYGPLVAFALTHPAPPHVYPSVSDYANTLLPGYEQAVRSGEAVALDATRHLTPTTDMSVVGYWPRAGGSYVITVIGPTHPGSATALDEPVEAAGRSAPEWSHWLAGGRAVEVFLLPAYVGADAKGKPPTDLTLTIDKVAPLPLDTAARAEPPSAGRPDTFRTIAGFKPVTLRFRVPASLYSEARAQRISDPVRWTMGGRWLELDTMTLTSAGESITGRIHLEPGDNGGPDVLGCPAVVSQPCIYGMRNPPRGGGTAAFTMQFFGSAAMPIPVPLKDLQVEVLGISLSRGISMTSTVPLPLPRGGEILARRDGAVVRVVAIGQRSISLGITSPPAQKPDYTPPGVGPGFRTWVIEHILGRPAFTTSNGPLVTLSGVSARVGGVTVDGGSMRQTVAPGQVGARAQSTVTYRWVGRLPVTGAHSVAVRVHLQLNLFPHPRAGAVRWPQ